MIGHSSGEIAAAYTAGMLSLESAMSVAYFRGKLSSQLVPKEGGCKGAMLASGLSAEDAKPYIEGVTSGKITIACINSPKSVTISGDLGAIDELHSRLEADGIFSRKLKLNVAYHSFHMKAIAEEYSRSLRGLNVQPRNRAVNFYSSVFPGIPVETNAEYWVQNLLSPVRFSKAVKIMLESEIDTTTCIEIGPHSSLAGPFKQISQSLAAEARAEYLPSILRNEDGVENVLKLACKLFHNSWTLNISAINFPTGTAKNQVLTDLPPYPWSHTTHWHEGRLSQNYRRRMKPPHSLLGTLMDDSSDLDMRWTKYIRQSELPWLKDHVIRSEVLLPAGAYLAMAMEAVDQKASISGLQVQEGYTIRDVTFSKVLVVPDTPDGIEVSLILEPFRQSSAATSRNWDEFRVISFGADRKAYEHCHGLISARLKPEFDFSSDDEATLVMMRDDKSMNPDLYKQWITQAAARGNELGPSFQLVSECCLKDGHVFCKLSVPETSDESPSTIGVPLMDTFLQITVLSLAGGSGPLEGSMVPTSIAEMVISSSIGRHAGHALHTQGTTTALGPRDFEGEVIVAQGRDDILVPVVKIRGARFVCIPKDEESDDSETKMCWNVLWKECPPDGLSQKDIAKRWPIPKATSHEVAQTVMCERGAWYCLRSAYESLTDADVEKMASHHQDYYRWMEKRYVLAQNGDLPFQKNGHQQEWSSTDQHTVEDVLQTVAALGAQGRMAIRVGRRLLDILRGEVEPLSLMLEDDLLNKYYAESRGQDRVYEQAARFVSLAAHRNPRLKLLEIGAGTGYVLPRPVFSPPPSFYSCCCFYFHFSLQGSTIMRRGFFIPSSRAYSAENEVSTDPYLCIRSATSWILKALGGYDNEYPRFSSYAFTDISTGFFETAQTKFKAWGSLISYKSLNIEEDLKAQGFDETGEYDIIVAANVLHATHNMRHTMSQVNKMLKPGGKLILVEATAGHQISGELVFGLLPGWWMGT